MERTAMKTKLHERPTRSGLWHPVVGKSVGDPVEVEFRTFEGKRSIHVYNYGREESYGLEGFAPGVLWLRYRAPKVTL